MQSSATEQQTADLRYPVGNFEWSGSTTPEERQSYLSVLAKAPDLLRQAVAGLNDSQLDTPYRPAGWTVRQVVHHVVDSHMNSYIRFRLALTEENPTIKSYDEALWAQLPDANGPLVETSLCLLDCLHKRWIALLSVLSEQQWLRTLHHPESGTMSLDKVLAIYAWHSRHHVAHINNLRARMGW
jgi:hypothetical protein